MFRVAICGLYTIPRVLCTA